MRDCVECVLTEPFVLLGRRLRPLSIGHLILMDRFGVQPVDNRACLVMAVLICSQTYDAFLETIQDPWLNVKLRLWGVQLGSFDVEQKCTEFNAYLEVSQRGPDLIESEGGRVGAPWLQHLKVTLCARLGYRRMEALDMPYSEAMWDYYTFHELDGAASILNEEDEAMFHAADDMAAETLAKANQRLTGAE